MQSTEIQINNIRNNFLITDIAVNDVVQTTNYGSNDTGKYYLYIGKNKSITLSFTNHAGYGNSLYQANLTHVTSNKYNETLGSYVSFVGNTSATIHTGEYEYVMFQCSYQTAYAATVTAISDDIKLVNGYQLDNDLTSVANAIRAKSGGSSPLAFPAGFVSEIGNIPSGGGGDWEEINYGGTNPTTDWEAYIIINQDGNIMGAECSVTVGNITRSITDESRGCYHITKIPLATTVAWDGYGDRISGFWGKSNRWQNSTSQTISARGNTTLQYGTEQMRGIFILYITSPET